MTLKHIMRTIIIVVLTSSTHHAVDAAHTTKSAIVGRRIARTSQDPNTSATYYRVADFGKKETIVPTRPASLAIPILNGKILKQPTSSASSDSIPPRRDSPSLLPSGDRISEERIPPSDDFLDRSFHEGATHTSSKKTAIPKRNLYRRGLLPPLDREFIAKTYTKLGIPTPDEMEVTARIAAVIAAIERPF